MSIDLNEDQKVLMTKLKDWWIHRNKPFFVYSGEAGTGKTTVIMEFINELELTREEYVCAALVGKAVLVMLRKGLPAKTIHSLIFDTKVVQEEGPDSPRMFKFVLKESLGTKLKLLVIDEGSMVDDNMLQNLLSFGLPIVFCGDMNQLPPVFGHSTVMMHPDHVLTQLMRQSEGDPIVWIAHQFSNGCHVPVGEYGKNVRVLEEIFMGPNLINDYDVILCATNRTRDILNWYIRKEVLCIHQDKYPVIGDKMICRENEWGIMIDDFSLTNGTVGYVRDIILPRKREIKGKRPKMKIDFQPDYLGRSQCFRKLPVDLKYLWATPTEKKYLGLSDSIKFEYGYSLTTHLSQGSEYPRVLFVNEPAFDRDTRNKLRYTAATRAFQSLDVLDFYSGFQCNRFINKFISQCDRF